MMPGKLTRVWKESDYAKEAIVEVIGSVNDNINQKVQSVSREQDSGQGQGTHAWQLTYQVHAHTKRVHYSEAGRHRDV